MPFLVVSNGVKARFFVSLQNIIDVIPPAPGWFNHQFPELIFIKWEPWIFRELHLHSVATSGAEVLASICVHVPFFGTQNTIITVNIKFHFLFPFLSCGAVARPCGLVLFWIMLFDVLDTLQNLFRRQALLFQPVNQVYNFLARHFVHVPFLSGSRLLPFDNIIISYVRYIVNSYMCVILISFLIHPTLL